MVRVKMTRNAKGSPNGYIVKQYDAGKEYDLPEGLARAFVEDQSATVVAVKPASQEDVKAEEAPKNKAEKAPKNKGE